MKNKTTIKPFGATPTYRQLYHYKLGKKAFFHFGVNTFSGNEWGDGTEKEKSFNPTDIDVRGWIRDVKAAGFKLAIITAKHHDGFCLWPSKYTEHSVKNSPYKDGKGDIIREFTDACHEYGIGAGIYISPWDRNSPYWGAPEYSTYFANQLEEIVTQYGKLDEIWWDGAGSLEAKYDWELWASIIRKNQPDAVIFGSMGATPYVEMRWVGTEAGYAGRTHYASVNREMMEKEVVEDLNRGVIGGELYIPAEVDVSIRPGWFYHKDQDDFVKSPRVLDDIWFRSVGNNAIMLLNFPPDTTGNLVRRDVENAIESNDRIEKMLSVNFIDGATLSADSTYAHDTPINAVLLDDDADFYASDENRSEAVINIDLPEDVGVYNTIVLAEKVELGERITDFVLENLDGDMPEILYTGTSVGYLRAVRFKAGAYKKLRLTVKGVAAPLTLRKIALHYYPEDASDPVANGEKPNIAALSTAKIIFEDNFNAQIMFGGIYPFDTVSFMMGLWGNYKIKAFDGSKYYTVAEGYSKDYRVTVKLDRPITSSYQLKIELDNPLGFAIDPSIVIC